jgi:hypothetical protein
MNANNIGDALLLSAILGGVGVSGVRRGLADMDRMHLPLHVRLDRVMPKAEESSVDLSTKEGSEKSESLFSKFREKVAAKPIGMDKLLTNIMIGTPVFEGVSALGKGLGSGVKPVADVMGYHLYQSMYPGLSGMMSYTRAPETMLTGALQGVGGELGGALTEGVGKFISSIADKNKEMTVNSPRRKLIFDQLLHEDDLVRKMDKRVALEAYHSMIEVAPTLSLDKNAVKSFLRMVSLAPEGGVDWNTLKGLADAEASINKAKGK